MRAKRVVTVPCNRTLGSIDFSNHSGWDGRVKFRGISWVLGMAFSGRSLKLRGISWDSQSTALKVCHSLWKASEQVGDSGSLVALSDGSWTIQRFLYINGILSKCNAFFSIFSPLRWFLVIFVVRFGVTKEYGTQRVLWRRLAAHLSVNPLWTTCWDTLISWARLFVCVIHSVLQLLIGQSLARRHLNARVKQCIVCVPSWPCINGYERIGQDMLKVSYCNFIVPHLFENSAILKCSSWSECSFPNPPLPWAARVQDVLISYWP